MASSPLKTRSTGAVLDVALRAAGAAPHRAVVRSVLRSRATCCVDGRCIWAGLRTRWAQDASKPMLLASLLDAFLASAHAACGINIQIALSSASAHARGCGSEVASIYQPRADESARRVALEPVLAHACRPSEYMSVVSVVSMYQTYGIYTLQLATTNFERPLLFRSHGGFSHKVPGPAA